MLADTLIVISVLVFIFAVADILLSSEQKSKLDTVVIRAWNKLDDWKAIPFRVFIRSFWIQISGCFFVLVILLWFMFGPSPGVKTIVDVRGIASALVIILFPLLVSFVLLRWSLSPFETEYVLRIVISAIIITLLVPYATYGLLYLLIPPLDPNVHYYPTDFGIGAFFMFAWSVTSAFVAIVVIFVPYFTVRIFILFLFIAEFMARRIAEYPKGVVLAGSAVATAAAGIFKALS